MMKNYKPSHAEWLAGHTEEIKEGVRVWRPAVPRTPDILAKCVFYVYLDEDEAKAGSTDSATGFFFGVRSEYIQQEFHLYAVTNRHVVDQIDTPTLRINTQKGSFETLVTQSEEWNRHPLNCDLAVYSFGLNGLDNNVYNFWFFDSDYLITKEFLEQYHIGAGDDIFMIGNFQYRGGRKRNIPSLRFGNISQMPDEPMENPHTGYDEESFIVEMRSTSGYSGSPVVLTNLDSKWSYYENDVRGGIGRAVTLVVPDFFKLLGIDWGHIATREYLFDRDGKRLPSSESVLINSAMAGVVPCWKLAEMIFSEEEIEMRKKKDKERQKKIDQSPIRVDFEKEKKEHELTKEEFEDALRKIARPLKKDDQAKKGT